MITKVLSLPLKLDVGEPFADSCIPANALKPGSVVRWFFAVVHVFAVRSQPQICSSVIERVAVYVIDLHIVWSLHNQAMHIDASRQFFVAFLTASCVALTRALPTSSANQRNVCCVNNRNAPSGQGNVSHACLYSNGAYLAFHAVCKRVIARNQNTPSTIATMAIAATAVTAARMISSVIFVVSSSV